MTATTSTTTYPTARPAIKGRLLAALFIAGAAAIGTVTVATQLDSSDTSTNSPPTRARAAETVARPAGMPDGVWNELTGVAPAVAVSPLAVAELVRPAGMPDGVWQQVQNAASATAAVAATELVRPAGMPDGVWSDVSGSSAAVGARPAGIPDGVWAAINE